MKSILGLDIGTNSVGWAVVHTENKDDGNTGKIVAAGSRVIPMDLSAMIDFNKGVTVSKSAERTRYRMLRRVNERFCLRRERLNRVLNVMGFLPAHYASQLDRYGKILNYGEPKIAWVPNQDHTGYEFLFKDAFNEMVAEIKQLHPELTCISYDWTIYYLRKKALTQKVGKEELAWLLHSFNSRRGFYERRGEGVEKKDNKREEVYSLRVEDIIDTGEKRGINTWYDVILENGFVYHYPSLQAPDWIGKVKDFIVTTTLDAEGNPMYDKNCNIKRSLRMLKGQDWHLLKIKTESYLLEKNLTVGEYIYNDLLHNPGKAKNGGCVLAIDRNFYRKELSRILEVQQQFYPEFQDETLLKECVESLYPHNPVHQKNLLKRNLAAVLFDDIIFYQRPLKSQKKLANNCPYEYHKYVNKATGEVCRAGIRCVAESHPVYQEFQLWQFIGNVHIYKRLSRGADGVLKTDIDVTEQYLPDHAAYVRLFSTLVGKDSISEDQFLRIFKLRSADYRWNYVEGKSYSVNETRNMMANRLKKAGISPFFLTEEREMALWHILYSVSEKIELEKALTKFAEKNGIADTPFVTYFKQCPPFKENYAGFSLKAIKRLLPLLRRGIYWKAEEIDAETLQRIQHIIEGKGDEKFIDYVQNEKHMSLSRLEDFQGLPLWLACELVYGHHSDMKNMATWNKPEDIDVFLQNFRPHSLRNSVVERVVLEMIRVVRDVWKKVGSFDEVHVALGREMRVPVHIRRKVMENNIINEWTNLRIRTLLDELANPEFCVEGVRPYSLAQQEILRIYEDGVFETVGKHFPIRITNIIKKFREVEPKKRPTRQEVLEYKMWLDNKYTSPYTGQPVPLAKLFTSAYEMEHVIPQCMFFDNSCNNKVICEAEVNRLKGNSLAMEFILQHQGEKVPCASGDTVQIMMPKNYEKFVQKIYGNRKRKLQGLLMTELPENFADQHMQDNYYISRFVTSILSNIVREKEEKNFQDGSTSKNVIVCTSKVSNRLQKDWEFNNVWNHIIAPRFERLNRIEKGNRFGQWELKNGLCVFQTKVPVEIQKGFKRSRIDFRYPALKAIMLACADHNLIDYLNNRTGDCYQQDSRENLQNQVCYKRFTDEEGNYSWVVRKPWESLTEDTEQCLKKIIVSSQQRLRVFSKTTNRYEHYNLETGKKEKVLQTRGDRLSIRKPMHRETTNSVTNLLCEKTVKLDVALKDWSQIIDPVLKRKIGELLNLNYTDKMIREYFKSKQESEWKDLNLNKIAMRSFTEDNEKTRMVASRKPLEPTTDIDKITDSNIQKILRKHLEVFGGNKKEAFSPEGIEQMNANICELNGGKKHQPIYKVRISEVLGYKFTIGHVHNKDNKYVEAAWGTNLVFAVYQKDNVRKYSTVPLHVLIKRKKQGLSPVPEVNEGGYPLLFTLSPYDLVYVPKPEEIGKPINMDTIDRDRIYKMISTTKGECSFVPHYIASPIIDTVELGLRNKSVKTLEGESIRPICIPLKIDKLGNILN